VLAVQVDYEKQQATIGFDRDQPAPKEAVLSALKAIDYQGEFVE
jgi:hypothetical protein